ncbi:hypothetical protein NKG94_00910 [Micromonospora sp. M12]
MKAWPYGPMQEAAKFWATPNRDSQETPVTSSVRLNVQHLVFAHLLQTDHIGEQHVDVFRPPVGAGVSSRHRRCSRSSRWSRPPRRRTGFWGCRLPGLDGGCRAERRYPGDEGDKGRHPTD